MRPEIFLHIGIHKTGTTFLQLLIQKHRQLLLNADGLLFPNTGLSAARHHGPKPNGLPGHSAFCAPDARQSLIRSLRNEVASSAPRRVFISAENLSIASPAHAKALVGDLETIGPVTIIITLRRQDKWIDSFYRQEVAGNRHGETRDFRTFLDEEGPLLLDYQTRFGFWRSVGFSGAFIAASFDDLTRGPGIAGWFCQTVGITEAADALLSSDVPRYPSLTRIETEITRLMNLSPALGSAKRTELLRAIYDLEPASDAPFVTDDIFEELREAYEPANRALAAEWNISPSAEFTSWRKPKPSENWSGHHDAIANQLTTALNGMYMPASTARRFRRLADAWIDLRSMIGRDGKRTEHKAR